MSVKNGVVVGFANLLIVWLSGGQLGGHFRSHSLRQTPLCASEGGSASSKQSRRVILEVLLTSQTSPASGPQATCEELLIQRSQAGHQRSKELSEQLGGIKTKHIKQHHRKNRCNSRTQRRDECEAVSPWVIWEPVDIGVSLGFATLA